MMAILGPAWQLNGFSVGKDKMKSIMVGVNKTLVKCVSWLNHTYLVMCVFCRARGKLGAERL